MQDGNIVVKKHESGFGFCIDTLNLLSVENLPSHWALTLTKKPHEAAFLTNPEGLPLATPKSLGAFFSYTGSQPPKSSKCVSRIGKEANTGLGESTAEPNNQEKGVNGCTGVTSTTR